VFEPLYHGDRLRVLNPRGDVGLLTMWSPLPAVERRLDFSRLGRVAVMSNLYGDGLFAMFCNLLFNPQIRHLVAVGEDLQLGVPEEIEAFLREGLEDAELLGRPFRRIRGTQRLLPAVRDFDAERLRRRLTFRYFGKLSRPGISEELASHLASLGAHAGAEPRLRVEIPREAAPSQRPSRTDGHQVIRRRPLDCWEELVVRCARFGRPVELAKGPRIELEHAKAVITEPADDPAAALAGFGFSLDRFRAYQERILQAELPEGIAYTYGNRLRSHFGGDALAAAARALREDPETRHAYVSLWDTAADPGHEEAPCLTTLSFRRAEGRLGLGATYRSHNLLTAWLENAYGLMAVQRHVAERAGMEPGPITVVSHSLTIDPGSPRYGLAQSIAEGWRGDDDVDRATGKRSLREDPQGYFVVSADRERGLVVAEHRFRGVLVKRYEAERAVTIENQVAADMAVSLVSHAMWLGRELTRAERGLR
jgi:thymidylate synthase